MPVTSFLQRMKTQWNDIMQTRLCWNKFVVVCLLAVAVFRRAVGTVCQHDWRTFHWAWPAVGWRWLKHYHSCTQCSPSYLEAAQGLLHEC